MSFPSNSGYSSVWDLELESVWELDSELDLESVWELDSELAWAMEMAL
jgi:hypothetical protein